MPPGPATDHLRPRPPTPPPYAWVRQASVDVVPYLPVEDCGPALDDLLGPSLRSRLAIGPLQHRRTGPRPEGYLANTCVYCDATQGSFPLNEDMDDFLAGDASRMPALWADGVEVDFPVAALQAIAAAHGSAPESRR